MTLYAERLRNKEEEKGLQNPGTPIRIRFSRADSEFIRPHFRALITPLGSSSEAVSEVDIGPEDAVEGWAIVRKKRGEEGEMAAEIRLDEVVSEQYAHEKEDLLVEGVEQIGGEVEIGNFDPQGVDPEVYPDDLQSGFFSGIDLLERAYDKELVFGQKSLGPGVHRIQQALVELGYLAEDDVDGMYGRRKETKSKTGKAVVAFQISEGLEDRSGVVGQETMRALDRMFIGVQAPTPSSASEHEQIADTEASLKLYESEFFESEKRAGTTDNIVIPHRHSYLREVPAHYSRQDIADFYGMPIDNFDVVESAEVLNSSKPRYAIKFRDYGLVPFWSISRMEKTIQERLPKMAATMKKHMDDGGFADWDKAKDLFYEWSQYSDMALALGENYFDLFLDELQKTGQLTRFLDDFPDSDYNPGGLLVVSQSVRLRRTLGSRSDKYAEAPYISESQLNPLEELVVNGYQYYFPVGEFIRQGEGGVEVFDLIVIDLVAMDEDIRICETMLRNSPTYKRFGDDPVAKVMVPHETGGRKVWLGMAVGFRDPVLSGGTFFDYQNRAPTGNIYWYYPETVFIPAGDHNQEFYKGNHESEQDANLKFQRIWMVAKAVHNLRDYLELDRGSQSVVNDLMSLDYDSLTEIENQSFWVMAIETKILAQSSHHYSIPDYRREIIRLLFHRKLKGRNKERLELLTRLLETTPNNLVPDLITYMEDQGFMAEMLAMLEDVGGSGLEAAFALGQVLTGSYLTTSLTSAEPYQLADEEEFEETVGASEFKIGKDDNLYFLVDVQIGEQDGVAGIFFQQLRDETWQDADSLGSRFFAEAGTMIPLQLVGGETQYVTAIELAVIASAMNEALENGQEWEQIFDVISWVLLIGSLIFPVAGLVRAVGVTALRMLIRTGSRTILRGIIRRMLVRQGLKALGRLALEGIFIGVLLYEDEIRKMKYGDQFMWAMHAVMIGVITRDFLKLFRSGLLKKFCQRGLQVAGKLFLEGKVVVGRAVTRMVNDTLAAARAANRIVNTSMRKKYPELAVKLEQGGMMRMNLSKAEEDAFNQVMRYERTQIALEQAAMTLGKTSLKEAPELTQLLNSLGNRLKGESGDLIRRKVALQIEYMGAQDLKLYVQELNQLFALTGTASMGHVSRYYPFLMLSASNKAVIGTARHEVIRLAREFGALGTGRCSNRALESIAIKLGDGSMKTSTANWLLGLMNSANPKGRGFLNFLAERTATPWKEFQKVITKLETGSIKSGSKEHRRLESQIRGIAAEYITQRGGTITNRSGTIYSIGKDQVKAGTKVIDYEAIMVQNKSYETMAEVKGWTASTWRDNLKLHLKGQSSYLDNMFAQLQAAFKTTQKPPVLVVTDTMPQKTFDDLVTALQNFTRDDKVPVEIARISEKQIVSEGNLFRDLVGIK